MEIKQIYRIFIGIVFFSKLALGCPLAIKNDGKLTILAIDPHNKQAIRIIPGKSQIIDPTIHGWQKYIRKEKLDVYYPQKPRSDIFYRKYQLTEKYCSEIADENKLRLSSIEKMADHPTDRFLVKTFKFNEKTLHHHIDNHTH
jgi:hypothetical protein